MKVAGLDVLIGQCKFQVSHCASQDSPLLSGVGGAAVGGVGFGLIRERFER
jgi:hypothetical protein